MNNKYKCFTIKSLKNIASKLNKKLPKTQKININDFDKNNKQKLIQEIQMKLNCKKHIDFCKVNKTFLNSILVKPNGPTNKNSWLSSLDIQNVMREHEKINPDFIFMGPYPIDFATIYDEIANINLKKLNKHHNKIGIIFNTDPSYKSGEHWISLFFDNKTICFFDSSGDKPPTEVKNLIKKIKTQSKKINKPLKVIINTKEFQKDNSSCGIWSLYHIISRLNGKSCNEIYNSNINDNLMYKKRKEYFS
jgi:hypothetical protein